MTLSSRCESPICHRSGAAGGPDVVIILTPYLHRKFQRNYRRLAERFGNCRCATKAGRHGVTTGDTRVSRRPIDPHLEALVAHGAATPIGLTQKDMPNILRAKIAKDHVHVIGDEGGSGLPAKRMTTGLGTGDSRDAETKTKKMPKRRGVSRDRYRGLHPPPCGDRWPRPRRGESAKLKKELSRRVNSGTASDG